MRDTGPGDPRPLTAADTADFAGYLGILECHPPPVN